MPCLKIGKGLDQNDKFHKIIAYPVFYPNNITNYFMPMESGKCSLYVIKRW